MASLLREIQDAATNDSVRVHALLLKARMLAARLRHDDFAAWIGHELDGYGNGVAVPSYRQGFRKTLFGTFVNFQYKVSNVQIPMSAFPDGLRDLEMDFDVRFPISTVESFANSKEESIKLVVPAELSRYVRLYENAQCVELWAAVPRHGFRAVLDAVRDKVLQYSIEIERVNPRAGEADPGEQPVSPEKLRQIQQTVIYGSHNVVATAGSNLQLASIVQVGDLSALLAEVRRLAVPEDDLRELQDAIRSDEGEDRRAGLGPRVRHWLGRMAENAARGSWQVGSQVATQVLAKLLMNYYGIP